jgi:hypothetical protein
MVPVCTADLNYRGYYSSDTIQQLKNHFGRVEAWCDCKAASGFQEGVGTGYDVAQQMVKDLGLNGPAWGECESSTAFDNGYGAGCRRFVGKLSDEVMGGGRLNHVSSGEVHVTVELYANCMPWVQPDWKNANAGVGGNCPAVYEDSTPCYYTPIQWYKDKGYYVPHRDSVYAIQMKPADWAALA